MEIVKEFDHSNAPTDAENEDKKNREDEENDKPEEENDKKKEEDETTKKKEDNIEKNGKEGNIEYEENEKNKGENENEKNEKKVNTEEHINELMEEVSDNMQHDKPEEVKDEAILSSLVQSIVATCPSEKATSDAQPGDKMKSGTGEGQSLITHTVAVSPVGLVSILPTFN